MRGARELWRQAPLWRTAAIGAVLVSAVALWAVPGRNPASAPATDLRPVASYTPITLAEPPRPASTLAVAVDIAAAPPLAPSDPPVPQTVTPVRPVQPDRARLDQPGGVPRELRGGPQRTYTRSFVAGGRTIPLPHGEFAEFIRAGETVGSGQAENVVVARIVDGQVRVMVVALTSRIENRVGTGFRRYGECENRNVHERYVEVNEDFGRQDCVVINHTWPNSLRAAGSTGIFRAAAGALDARGARMPPAFVQALFRAADRDGYLTVRYFFDPEMRGIRSRPTASWADSDWHMTYIAQDPLKVAYVDEVRAWALQWRALIQRSYAGALDIGSVPVGVAARLP